MIDKNEICTFISDKLGFPIGESEMDMEFRELGIDSLYMFELVNDLDKKYNMQIDIEDTIEINTINKLYQRILETSV